MVNLGARNFPAQIPSNGQREPLAVCATGGFPPVRRSWSLTHPGGDVSSHMLFSHHTWERSHGNGAQARLLQEGQPAVFWWLAAGCVAVAVVPVRQVRKALLRDTVSSCPLLPGLHARFQFPSPAVCERKAELVQVNLATGSSILQRLFPKTPLTVAFLLA